MLDLVCILTKTEILLESSMFGTMIASYLMLIMVLIVSFVNIYSVDKFEFLNKFWLINQNKSIKNVKYTKLTM